jgi:hypothetical protein
MENPIPRLIEQAEAKRLGIDQGWYGARVSGTFVTGRCASFDACIATIGQLPVPVEKPAAQMAATLPTEPTRSNSIYSVAGPMVATPYQMGHKSPANGLGYHGRSNAR